MSEKFDKFISQFYKRIGNVTLLQALIFMFITLYAVMILAFYVYFFFVYDYFSTVLVFGHWEQVGDLLSLAIAGMLVVWYGNQYNYKFYFILPVFFYAFYLCSFQFFSVGFECIVFTGYFIIWLVWYVFYDRSLLNLTIG